MPQAFLFITTEIGSEAQVLQKLKEIRGVEEVYIVYGLYDLIAKVKIETISELRENIVSKIRKIGQVKSTSTMIVEE